MSCPVRAILPVPIWQAKRGPSAKGERDREDLQQMQINGTRSEVNRAAAVDDDGRMSSAGAAKGRRPSRRRSMNDARSELTRVHHE